MTAATDKFDKNDPMVGYFASVVIGILCSSLLAGVLADLASILVSGMDLATLQVNLAAGMFIALSFSNPVGSVIAKKGFKKLLVRFVMGFAAGVSVQACVLSPIAGQGMSFFLLLLVAILAVPTMLMVTSVRQFLDARGIVPANNLAQGVIRVLSWPDRVLFVILMGISFTLFWQFAETSRQVMYVLGVVLGGFTVWETIRHTPEVPGGYSQHQEHLAWLELEPKENQTNVQLAIDRVKDLAQTLLPGAILFGGVTRLAVDFLFLVYPQLTIDVTDPAAASQSIAIVILSGLSVILFGMMAALGFCLLVIKLIGRIKRWPPSRLRHSYVHIIKSMYFRPMDRV